MNKTDITTDECYMLQALELATKGLGTVSPNPMVGCVIVHNGEVIGKGYHKKYGGKHAEVHAIESVRAKKLLKGATLYVTLEPCVHYGKTPPCVDFIIRYNLPKVVISNKDPNPLVNGVGIKKLQEAGIDVIVGVLDKEGKELNKRFFTRLAKFRPYVILKWAETLDGFIARKNYDSKWISGEQSRQLTHQWRADEDAIWVGVNTAKHDNPRLNVRNAKGNDPMRIVIDKQLVLNDSLHLFNQKSPTMIYNLKENKKAFNIEWVKVEEENLLDAVLKDLSLRGVQSIILEGGATLLNTVIKKELWDEARVFYCPLKFEEGIRAPTLAGSVVSVQTIEQDILKVYHKRPNK